jgi:hypothetical protein
MARNLLLPSTAAFAFAWIAARAWIQSITIDEADTYLAYVGPRSPTHWSGSANNQILNSLLMRLSTCVFGVSHLSVRMPALLGAAIYISAAFVIVRVISEQIAIQLPVLVCLLYNPLVMDHLVAARGYSLALGMWMAASALAWRVGRPALGLASLCAGLSFSANFSFAFVNAFTMAAVCVWACREEPRLWPRTIAVCVLPGLVTAAFLTGSVVAAWPRNQLVYGAHSLRETLESIVQCLLYELNGYFVNPPLLEFVKKGAVWIFPGLGVALVWRLAWAVSAAGGTKVPRGLKPTLQGAPIVMVFTVGAHWMLFRFAHVLLPKERTAIYLVPLLFLTAGAAAAIPGGKLSRLAIAAMLSVAASYFILCLRLTYFREWKWNADAKEISYVLAYCKRTYGAERIMTNWRYVAALNFYREIPGRDSYPQVQSQFPPYPDDRDLYVLYFPSEEGFIREHGLKIVYQSDLSETAVAIRPGLEDRPVAAVSCNGARPNPRSAPCN